jgi:hypothetical protein
MLKITRRVVFFEACAGLIQGTYGALKSGTFDSANGDIVQGTIYPFLRGDGAFANPMFSASMILLMLALLTDTSRNRANYLALCLGIVSVIVASVLHQLVFLFGALAGSYIIIRPKIPFSRGFLPMAALLGLIPILVIGLLSQNLGSFGETIGQFSRGESPRRIILDTVLFDMHREYPLMPVIGVGPGQFSSRAALINSGYYLGSPLGAREVSFFIRGEVAAPLAKYLLPLWIATAGNVFYGSTQKPYFSWLSVYSELGAVGLLFILVVACIIARRTIRSRRIGIAGMLQFGLLAAILFTLFLGAQENYFEVPQALLPGFIILKALYARAVSRNEFNSSQNLRFRRNHPSSSPLRLSQHQLAPLYSRVYGLPGVGSTRQCGLGDTVPEP